LAALCHYGNVHRDARHELRGLIWDNVDLDAGMIHVRRRAGAWKNMGDPKSKAGKRDIPRFLIAG